ncbi:hypothetical protein [Actinomadura spongiicola]|uniref:hypothetical protein n=1 Tax=Actinomadura spongiicola TaxID=2303421 RepID=UPI0011C0E85B|nr:hypothetical protein [Actinomadura spongiicola]
MARKSMQALTITLTVAGLGLVASAVPANASLSRSENLPSIESDQPPNRTPSNINLNCDVSPYTNGPGGATVDKEIWLRNGPGAGCQSVTATLRKGTRLGGWCYDYSNSNNLWYYVSVGGAAPHGWIYANNVTDVNPITTRCRY